MNITIVIPTHNRHEKLARILRYLDKESVKIIVIDSTKNPFDVTGYQRVEYFHNPNFNFSDKIIYACDSVTTDYICLCADDDFVLVDKLESLVAKSPKGTAAIIGSTVVFDENFNGEFRYQRKIRVDEFYVEENSKSFFSDYSQVLWGVYAVNLLRNPFLDIKELKFKNDNFIELYLSHRLIKDGGIFRTQEFFSIREVSPSDHWGKRHKNLRQAYFEDIETILFDISNIANLTGGKLFSSNFSSYIGKVQNNRSIARKVIRRVLGLVLHKLLKIGVEKVKENNETLSNVRHSILRKAK